MMREVKILSLVLLTRAASAFDFGGEFFNMFPDTPAPSASPIGFPTNAPIAAPTNAPVHDPTNAPVEHPTKALVQHPAEAPIEPRSGEQDGPTTRESTHQFQWGSIAEGCEFVTPEVYLSCGGGGLVTVFGLVNARCEELSPDFYKCFSEHGDDDAYVEFSCKGVTDLQLSGKAEILSSEAEGCSKVLSEVGGGAQTMKTIGGNVVLFGTLGRYCSDSAGDMTLRHRYSCTEGLQAMESGVSFCAAGQQCEEEQICSGGSCSGEQSCSVDVHGVSISDQDDDSSCSVVENSGDLLNYDFSPSKLASYHVVDWTFSGKGYGCEWEVPDVTLTCQNEGQIELVQELAFCQTEGYTIQCSNPVPNSQEQRESVEIQVWCYGNADQLILSAKTPSILDQGATCSSGGMAVHGIKLSRACGPFESESFKLVTDPSFCGVGSQIHEDTNLCFAGDMCRGDATCESVDVGAVSADSSSPTVDNCIYAR